MIKTERHDASMHARDKLRWEERWNQSAQKEGGDEIKKVKALHRHRHQIANSKKQEHLEQRKSNSSRKKSHESFQWPWVGTITTTPLSVWLHKSSHRFSEVGKHVRKHMENNWGNEETNKERQQQRKTERRSHRQDKPPAAAMEQNADRPPSHW